MWDRIFVWDRVSDPVIEHSSIVFREAAEMPASRFVVALASRRLS